MWGGMKTNQVRINIKANISKVFEFTLDPNNTSRWIESITEEKVDTKKIGMGTIYTNDFGSYTVTDYDRDKFFELTDHKTGYICSYTFKEKDQETEIIYFEYMENGEDLKDPLDQKSFELLKELLETN